MAKVSPGLRACEGIRNGLEEHGASPAFARAGPSRRPLRGLLRMTTFPNAINDVRHAEERPEGVSRSTHDRNAAFVFLSHSMLKGEGQ